MLVFFSPVVSGKVGPTGDLFTRLTTGRWFPLENPGIISIPARLPASAGSARSPRKEPEAEERYTELEVRALTGAGSEAAVHALSRPRPHVDVRAALPREGRPDAVSGE